MEIRVGTIMVIGTETGVKNKMVIKGTRMTTKRRVIDISHRVAEISSLEWNKYCRN